LSDNVRRVAIVLVFAAFGGLLFGIDRLITAKEADTINSRVTRIESPCQRYGSKSQLCQEAFETAVKSINHRIACYIDRKSGRPFKPSCLGVHLRIEAGEPKSSSVPESGTRNGGDASEAQPGHSQPGPSGGQEGHGHQPSHGPASSKPEGGGESGGAPPSSSAPTSSQPTSSSTETTRESVSQKPAKPSAPVTPPVPPIKEAVGGVVEEAGGTVAGTVEGVTEPVCTLAKLLCP
jgi:hypothetical protein